MAAEVSNIPVNGTYAPHQAYGSIDPQQSYNAYPPNPAAAPSAAHAPGTASTPGPASQQSDIPKDEVGWYFVEQYYTTLSRSPEKLYLFYNKRSQFVSGQETDKVAVCVGQRAINDRIKELDFQDCKVRVTNVDSQASDSNIVIQVIGEISNKSQPHKKFTQTFVLATQTNGYFVLNDIFRYLIEEEDEEPSVPQLDAAEQPAAEPVVSNAPQVVTAETSEPKTLTSSVDPVAIEHDAQQVDKELEEQVLKEAPAKDDATAEPVNGVRAAESTIIAEDAPVAVPAVEPAEPVLQPEKPKDPEPTPVATTPKQTPSQPAPAPKPAVPKTWASLAASANKTPTGSAPPAAPSAATAPANTTTAAQSKTVVSAAKVAAPSAAPSAAGAAPATAAVPREPSPAETPEQDEWTAVGGAHNRQQSRQVHVQQSETPQYRGYIKNVHEGIDGPQLRSALEKVAEVTYFDIARQKNCAFVDFKTAEDYNAAVNASPHIINGESLYVVERHVRPGSTPYVPRGQFQGSRGRGGASQGAPRGNFQGGGRGGFVSRGRGGAPAARGRGGAQPA